MYLPLAIHPFLLFYAGATGFVALFYALMYSGAKWNVKQLRAMGRGEVEYYYRFIELIDGLKPLMLPGGLIAFVGGLALQFLFGGGIERGSGLVAFGGYVLLLLVALGWVAEKGVEAGERADISDVDPFHGPWGIPMWMVGTATNYVIFGFVFAIFWHGGVFDKHPFVWVFVPLAVVGTPLVLYRRYQSLEEQSKTDDRQSGSQ